MSLLLIVKLDMYISVSKAPLQRYNATTLVPDSNVPL